MKCAKRLQTKTWNVLFLQFSRILTMEQLYISLKEYKYFKTFFSFENILQVKIHFFSPLCNLIRYKVSNKDGNRFFIMTSLHKNKMVSYTHLLGFC